MKIFGAEKYIAPIVGGVFDTPFIIFAYIFRKRTNSKNAQSEASKISPNAVLAVTSDSIENNKESEVAVLINALSNKWKEETGQYGLSFIEWINIKIKTDR